MKNYTLLVAFLFAMKFAEAQKEDAKKDTNAVVAPDLSPPLLTEDEYGNQVILKSNEQPGRKEMNKNHIVPKRSEAISRPAPALKVPVRRKKK